MLILRADHFMVFEFGFSNFLDFMLNCHGNSLIKISVWFSSASSVDESELARKIVHKWEEGIITKFVTFSVLCIYCMEFDMFVCLKFWISFFRNTTSLQAVCWSCSGADRQRSTL